MASAKDRKLAGQGGKDRRVAAVAAKAARKVADKVSGKGKVQQPASTTIPTTSTSLTKPDLGSVGTNYHPAISLNGLPQLNPFGIEAYVPKYDSSKFVVADPLKFDPNAPQITKAQFEQNKQIAEGMMFASQSYGLAADVAATNFQTIGKVAKAYTAGITASTDVEKANGAYLGYLSQVETNKQAFVNLRVNEYKTFSTVETAPHTKLELDSKLELARIKSESAKENTASAQNDLDTLRQKLGNKQET